MIKTLADYKFYIGETEKNRLNTITCDKMRSCAQFQVNKMRFPDQSTKDVILGMKKLSDNDYKIVKQQISDH